MITMGIDANWDKTDSATHVRAGRHKFLIDDDNGGKGPNAMQFMLSGMAGCLIGVGLMVAGEMGLDIGKIACRVEGDIDPAGYTGKDASVRPGCQEIRMTMEVKSPEPAEKIRDWLAVTEKRCPVRDCVANATPVKVVLK